jgi:hypothetical protein
MKEWVGVAVVESCDEVGFDESTKLQCGDSFVVDVLERCRIETK